MKYAHLNCFIFSGVDIFVHGVGPDVDKLEIVGIASPNNFNLNSDYQATCEATNFAKDKRVDDINKIKDV